MKGMVFTELLEFIEETFSFETADKVIALSKLPNGGAYTQAGNYPFEELVALVSSLSQEVKMPIDVLIEAYARHLFGRIVGLYPPMVEGFDSPLRFIAKVDDFIHPEVKKLYPDADLPHFEVISLSDTDLVIDYSSSKPLAAFAKGLMLGCSDFFHKPIEVTYEILQNAPKTKARFNIRLS